MSAIIGALALLCGFVEAPFAHVHRRDPDHRHALVMPHSHWKLAAERDLALRQPDGEDDVQPLDWNVSAGGSPQSLVAVVSEPAAFPAPVDRYELVRAPNPRAHGPPAQIALPPRAPPA